MPWIVRFVAFHVGLFGLCGVLGWVMSTLTYEGVAPLCGAPLLPAGALVLALVISEVFSPRSGQVLIIALYSLAIAGVVEKCWEHIPLMTTGVIALVLQAALVIIILNYCLRKKRVLLKELEQILRRAA